jgi:uncharacterized phage protein gp47/JayE
MGLTFAQLVTAKTQAQMRQQLLDALQGRGVVTHVGTGTGSLALSGTPVASYVDVRVKISTAGEPGAAAYQISYDGGATYGAAATVPASGPVALGSTGVSLTFAAGPAGAGTSFVLADVYSFAMATPTFPVDSWREGDVARTLVEIDAQALSDLTALVVAITQGGFLHQASASWLTLLASEVYGLTRNAAVATRGTVRLTATAEAGPYTIAPGQLRVASTSGLRFQSANTTNVTLVRGGTLDLVVQAESPGAAYNVANSTITTMLTQLAGVTCNNPDPGTGSWLTVAGVDEETDAALRSRCEARWPESGFGSPAASYDLWARTADATITRTKVVASGTVAGRVDIYVGGASGAVAAGAVTAAQNYITPRAPLGTTPVVTNATPLAVTVTATLYGKAQYQTAALAAAAVNLADLIAATPIGGTIYRAAIFGALIRITGVENVTIAAPAGDTALTTSQVATLSAGLSWSNT